MNQGCIEAVCSFPVALDAAGVQRLYEWEPGVTQVVGTFRPLSESDLSKAAGLLVGQRLEFRAGWPIDSGRYAGQWAMLPMIPAPVGWVPLCDLTEIEVV